MIDDRYRDRTVLNYSPAVTIREERGRAGEGREGADAVGGGGGEDDGEQSAEAAPGKRTECLERKEKPFPVAVGCEEADQSENCFRRVEEGILGLQFGI